MVAEPTKSKTKRLPPKKRSGGTGGGGYGGGSGGGGDDREPIGEEPENIDIHQAYLEYRLGGGERATTQAYARAFAQFQKLPGAVRGKPTIIPPQPSDEDDGGDVPPKAKGDAP